MIDEDDTKNGVGENQEDWKNEIVELDEMRWKELDYYEYGEW